MRRVSGRYLRSLEGSGLLPSGIGLRDELELSRRSETERTSRREKNPVRALPESRKERHRVKITILNFSDILKRKDLKNPSWFAVDIDIFTHQDYYKLTAEELRAWLWILTVGVCAKSEHVCLDFDHFEFQTRSAKSVILATIEKLDGKRLRVREPNRSVRNPSPQDKTEQDTTEQKKEEGTEVQLPPEQVELLPAVPVGTSVQKPPSSQELISSISPKIVARWAALYPEDFLRRELLKALNYYEANPRKLPKTTKGWSQSLSSWFERGWEWAAKKYPGQQPAGQVDIESILKERADAAKGI